VFAELLASEGVRETHHRGGPIGVMALHGGLEEGTDEIAAAVAGATGASLYAVVQPASLWWHVPSIRYDPAASPALTAFLGSIETSISLHGFGQPGLEGVALLGGRNRSLASQMRRHMAAHGVPAIADLGAIPRRLRGVHRRNPVNRPPRTGVQIELPMELRAGRPLEKVTAALVACVAEHEASR